MWGDWNQLLSAPDVAGTFSRSSASARGPAMVVSWVVMSGSLFLVRSPIVAGTFPVSRTHPRGEACEAAARGDLLSPKMRLGKQLRRFLAWRSGAETRPRSILQSLRFLGTVGRGTPSSRVRCWGEVSVAWLSGAVQMLSAVGDEVHGSGEPCYNAPFPRTPFRGTLRRSRSPKPASTGPCQPGT